MATGRRSSRSSRAFPKSGRTRSSKLLFEMFGRFDYKSASTEEIALKPAYRKASCSSTSRTRRSCTSTSWSTSWRRCPIWWWTTGSTRSTTSSSCSSTRRKPSARCFRVSPTCWNSPSGPFTRSIKTSRTRWTAGRSGKLTDVLHVLSDACGFDRFRDDIDPKVRARPANLVDGYLHQQRALHQRLDRLRDARHEMYRWCAMLKA